MNGVICPICDGAATRREWRGSELPSVSGRTVPALDLWRCIDCSTIFVYPHLSDGEPTSQRHSVNSQ